MFEICIDTLRSFEEREVKKALLTDPNILERVNDLAGTASEPVKKIIQAFLSKALRNLYVVHAFRTIADQ